MHIQVSFLYSDSQNHDSRYLQDHASDHRFSQATDYVLRMADLCAQIQAYSSHNHDTHTHPFTHLIALYPGLPGWAGTRKVKPIWILLKRELSLIHI